MTIHKIIFDLNDRVKSSEVLDVGTQVLQHGKFQIPIIIGLVDDVTLQLAEAKGDLYDLDIPSLRRSKNAEDNSARLIDTQVVPVIELRPRMKETAFSILGSRRDESYLAVKRLDRSPIKGERALDI